MTALRAARLPFAALPVVNIADWYCDDADARTTVARAVLRACREVGFFYVTGHKVPAAQIAEVFAMARAFFALPSAIKEEIHYRHGGFRRGYLPLLSESSDPTATGDLKEAFDCGLTPIADGAIDNLWPMQPDHFRDTIERYLGATRALAADILAMIASALGMPIDWFADKVSRPIATLRLLHYPAQEVPASKDILGIGEHCDYECLTVLAQDEVGGLQVRSADGTWVEAPPIAGAFIVNIGEMLARWSNDILMATPHRVINSSGAERFSIPVFFATNADVMIEPLASCVSADNPAQYPPIRAEAYLSARIQEIYLDAKQVQKTDN